MQLLGGLENEAYGRQQTAVGNQSGSLSGLMNLLSDQQAQWQQGEDARYGSQMSLLGTLGQAGGFTLGRGKV